MLCCILRFIHFYRARSGGAGNAMIMICAAAFQVENKKTVFFSSAFGDGSVCGILSARGREIVCPVAADVITAGVSRLCRHAVVFESDSPSPSLDVLTPAL